MHSPSDPIWLVQIGTLPGANPATCDPALNLAAGIALPRAGDVGPVSLRKALSDYESSRSVEDLERLPVLPGAAFARWQVQPLTPAGLRWAMSGTSATQQAHWCFLAVCHRYTDAAGNEHNADAFGGTRDHTRGLRIASDEWLDHVLAEYGQSLIDEVAMVAIERAKAPRALRPFALPRGLMLPL